MPNLLMLAGINDSVKARYKQMLLERFPQLTFNAVSHHSEVDPYIADTDILLTFSPPMADHVVRDAPKLKLIQALGTGIDNIVDLPSLGPEVIVANIRGIHGPPMSEATISYMLSLARDLRRSAQVQDRCAWERWPPALLDGKTVGILGVGLIAEHLAPMLKAFNMTVIGHQFRGTPVAQFRPHGGARRSYEGGGRARLSGGADAIDAGDAPYHQCQATFRHEANRPSHQYGARRRGR